MIETERLNIHIAETAEMEQLIRQQTDEGLIMAYGEMLEGSLRHPEQRAWYAIWMIERKDGAHVGELSFKGPDPKTGTPEIGYGIAEAYRGFGYATEAVNAAVLWALRQAGVRGVEAETEADNAPSVRVLEKCGFRATGELGAEGPRYIRCR